MILKKKNIYIFFWCFTKWRIHAVWRSLKMFNFIKVSYVITQLSLSKRKYHIAQYLFYFLFFSSTDPEFGLFNLYKIYIWIIFLDLMLILVWPIWNKHAQPQFSHSDQMKIADIEKITLELSIKRELWTESNRGFIFFFLYSQILKHRRYLDA